MHPSRGGFGVGVESAYVGGDFFKRPLARASCRMEWHRERLCLSSAAEHREAAFRLRTRSLVLKYIPMLGKNAIGDSQDAGLRHYQCHIDVAACCIGVRADDVGFLHQGFHLLAR